MATSIVNNVNKLVNAIMADTRLLTSTIFLLPAGMYLAYSAFRHRLAAPGPPRLPLLGNLFQIPSQLQFIRYTEWAQRYGPIFSLDVLGQHIVVLNTCEAAGDLFGMEFRWLPRQCYSRQTQYQLDRGSNIYNDRPRLVMANEILGGGVLLSVMKSNHSIAASSITTAVYGWPPLETESHMVQYIQDFVNVVSKTTVPGAYLVDTLPIMKYIPASIARWKREGLKWCDEQTRLFERFNEGVVEKASKGGSEVNFIADLMASKVRHCLSKMEFAWLPGALILAGTDTTAVSLINCTLALLHYPNVLRKAHEELDEVIGRDRAPGFGDKDNLPYIQAISRETLRWCPPVPLGIPHVASEVSIPQLATVKVNISFPYRAAGTKGTLFQRAVHHCCPKYLGYEQGFFYLDILTLTTSDPSGTSIRPKINCRCHCPLDSSGKTLTAPPDTHQMGHTSFGFGKRICPGMYFADQELFTGIAIMLWTFNIRPHVDEEGNEVLPDSDGWEDATIVVRPAPFKCDFSPRFPRFNKFSTRPS
ncbi:cytochrome P450 [Irpex rosettiformis]|uniref:Cytochrome P450 n=1 Tax=Irpex rosettiformis TaxID=378272 RepID=A0ACB8TZH6_9APHY|nr:cytochrome P450 [Irpex rosettiformis]